MCILLSQCSSVSLGLRSSWADSAILWMYPAPQPQADLPPLKVLTQNIHTHIIPLIIFGGNAFFIVGSVWFQLMVLCDMDTTVEWLIVLAEIVPSQQLRYLRAAAVGQALGQESIKGLFTQRGGSLCKFAISYNHSNVCHLTHPLPRLSCSLELVLVCIPQQTCIVGSLGQLYSGMVSMCTHFRNTMLCVPFLDYGIVMHNNVSSCSCNILMIADFMQFAPLHMQLKLRRCY